ncbi:hypothetical protein IE4872_CH00494 [Rhizobium gallicum]|uniref:Uncharacterized protein n=1 Tax=Rhizobium gallicum TaxID=56730 RepID=A0A1L5NE84_9HYPH|nr:hypothetical protein [Rhizobium gallicum]APO66159.1 hypothetical protein IE4872_CH00494 [Rhizobium gallicum]
MAHPQGHQAGGTDFTEIAEGVIEQRRVMAPRHRLQPVMQARRLREETGDLAMLDSRPPRLPGRRGSEDGCGDEGIDGQARLFNARPELLAEFFRGPVGNRGLSFSLVRYAS